MFPNGWTRPRISFAPASSSQNLFQIRLHSASESSDLVVYTSATNYTLPAPLWQSLSKNLVGPSVSVTVTAANASGGSAASSQTASFTIAPVPALGALIYWTSSSFDTTGATAATTTELKGFHVGDEGTTVALTSAQVAQPVDAVPVTNADITNATVPVYCIGCHTSTPDGNYVAFTAQWPWPNALANVNSSADAGLAVGQPPPWLTGGAAANLSPLIGPASVINPAINFYNPPVVNQVMLGVQTFSPSHYTTGDRKVVSSLGAALNSKSTTTPNTLTGVTSQLAWFDLEWTGTAGTTGFATAPCANPSSGTCYGVTPSHGGWGIIARDGDSQSAGTPSWSHNLDGKTDLIAYVSTDVGTKDGRLDTPGAGGADILTVPYNNGAGGTVTKVPGASDSNFNEYYPSWSPDDQLIAFNRVAAGNSMYDQPLGEVYVVEAKTVSCDGTQSAQCRLKANDPVACTGSASPGSHNTWPKWAPLPNVATGSSAANLGSDGKLYYYVTFSSTRATACTLTATSGALNTLCTAAQSKAAAGFAQLYVAAIVVDPNSGAITTYPAIYMWNQDAALNNLIPAWDYFPIAQGTSTPLQ